MQEVGAPRPLPAPPTQVTFGSSLDVAAIQAELPTRKLDYNKELTAIGWGNLCSSCSAGLG